MAGGASFSVRENEGKDSRLRAVGDSFHGALSIDTANLYQYSE